MIDCSRTENYFAEKQRMTKTTNKLGFCGFCGFCGIECRECPLYVENNDPMFTCTSLEKLYPEKAIAIVQKWSDEHPQKTYLSEFLKKYPNVQFYDTGIPKGICPYDLGLDLGLMSIEGCRNDRNCVKCWNQPIEESESNDKK